MKHKAKMRRLNFDSCFYHDIFTNKGFVITDPPTISFDGNKKKSYYGPQSPLYGTTYGDDKAFAERYRCECGEFTSRQFEGETCPHCGTKVEFKDVDIEFTGWISLGTNPVNGIPNRIISPLYYNLLISGIGRTVFPDIIKCLYRVDTNGHVIPLKDDEMFVKPSSPYYGIGIDAFYDRFDEIMDYFIDNNTKPSKVRKLKQLKKEKAAIFTSHIPIYSTMLRPQSITSDTFYFQGIDKIINTLVTLSNRIKEAKKVEHDYVSARIQSRVCDLWNEVFKLVNGKNGHIKNRVLGGSLNFTARNVIVPDTRLRDNEIGLSYHTFRELAKQKIIYYLMKIDGISMAKAYGIWQRSAKFDPHIYEIMNHIIHTEECYFIINRNPTINYSSILCMKVAYVNSDPTSYVLALPLSALKGLNADFDGDVLNMIYLPSKELVYMFRKFDPVNRMIISRSKGTLNEYFTIEKGQMIDLVRFATCLPSEYDTPETFPEEKHIVVPKSMVPHIHNRKELELYIEPMYVIENHMNSYDEYKDFVMDIYNVIKGSFEIRECREYPVNFKFRADDKQTYQLQLRHFIINAFIWYALVPLKGQNILDESLIFDCEHNMPRLTNFLDEVIDALRSMQIKSTAINRSISEVNYMLRGIPNDFSIIMNLNFSLKTIIDFNKKYPKAKAIMDSSYPANSQPAEIEEMSDKRLGELVDLFINDPGNPIGTILFSGTGIKTKQLSEFLISSGQISDIDGNTIPIAISNSIMQGFDKPSEIYISCLGGRKPLLANKEKMGNSGYFAKSLTMTASTLHLSTRISDCGSTHLVPYIVRDKATLGYLNGKYYKLNPRDKDLRCVNSKRDTHLIGKTIYCRSVATCACHDGEICHKCWGRMSSFNVDIPYGVAAYNSEELGQQMQQDILSTKHLLTTNSEKVEFEGPFSSYFTISCGEISPLPNCESDIDNLEDYAIYIDPKDISKMDELDEDSRFNTCIENGRFYIVNLNDKEKGAVEIKTVDGKELYISDEIISLMKKNKGYVHFTDIGEELTIFEITITNNELTKPIKDIEKLINRVDKDIDETIESLSQKLLDLMVKAHMHPLVTAMECIINKIITKPGTVERPDFSKPDIGPYEIITINKSIEKGPSPLLGMSFQYIKRQMTSDELYDERDQESYVDPFYAKEIPTQRLKDYINLIGDKPVSEFLDY